MISSASNAEIVNACRILFSPDSNRCSIDFVKNLTTDTLKKAYRKKAFETHPDRIRSSETDTSCQNERFIRVKTAYEVLMPVASGRIFPKAGNSKTEKENEGFYFGPMPLHKLRIGQFMYYSGDISWKTLIEAIQWHRKKRPLYGKIAEEWGMLTTDDIRRILRFKQTGEKIGACARRLGYLTLFQHLAVIGKQEKHHRQFGEYFVSKGLFTRRQMDKTAQRHQEHNEKIESGHL